MPITILYVLRLVPILINHKGSKRLYLTMLFQPLCGYNLVILNTCDLNMIEPNWQQNMGQCFLPFRGHDTTLEALTWLCRRAISTLQKTKITHHLSKIALWCLHFDLLKQGYFCQFTGAKTAPCSKWAKWDPNMALYFTHRKGHSLEAKTDLNDVRV